MESCQSTPCMLRPELNVSTRTFSLTKGGIGDDRCFIIDFSSLSVIRTRFQNIVWCAARRLHCKSMQLVQAYNHKLDLVCSRHKMHERIYFIYSHVEYLSNKDFAYLMNNWYLELTQYKLHLELNCTKFKSCDIEWSTDWFLVITTVVTCKSAKICLRSGTPRPLQYYLGLPPLSPVWPKVDITQQGYDPHPNHSAPNIATSQGWSHTSPKTLIGLAEGCWWKRGFGLLCCNTWNINPRAREKEMVPNQSHYPPAKSRSPNHTASTGRTNHGQYLFNGAWDVWTHLRPSISTVPPCSLSSVLPRSIVWWSWVYGRYQMCLKDLQRNLWLSSRYWRMDKEDIARGLFYVFTKNVRNWNCYNDHNGRLSKLLAMDGWKDFVIFQWSHIFSL